MLGKLLLKICLIESTLAFHLPLEFQLHPRKACHGADIISNLTAIGEHTKKWNDALKATHDGRAEAKVFVELEEETLETIKSMNKTVIGTSKHSFSSILEYDEDAINNYLFGLVGAVPDCLHEVAPLVNSLVVSLKTTVEAYGEYS
ncbi:uncharacterized protein N7483_000808 [Penicillium malachiteum]|uniref:uncharacterized protein n=1 Tax=Penicillium malachiteum TaxID=1324776 RepID=UPI002546E5C4|nr:uncharacterized protein N7483_000808 [Penicillium malachiteum]KAJ5735683.1 hypothetical protein N7483_000808 [Penicillium malachiteum]